MAHCPVVRAKIKMESILTVQQRGTVRRPMRHIVNLAYGSKVQKSEHLGPQGVSFIERLFLLCPLFGVSFIGGFTV